MKRQLSILQLIALTFLAFIIGVWIGDRFSEATPHLGNEEQGRALYKLDYALNIINRNYVDSLSLDTLIDLSLDAMLYSLDPHSIYLDPQTVKREEEQMVGRFDGIGVLMDKHNDTARVLQVKPNGPAAQVHMRPGDQILMVDGDTVAGQNYPLDKIIAKIKGPRRSNVTLGILRPGDTTARNITLRRSAIATPSIDYYDMLTDTIGYVSITSFSRTTGKEFRHSLQQLKERGMTHLILDLRGNGGGSMEAAERVANELLPANRPIVYTQGAHRMREESRSYGSGLFSTGGLTVMINENSASASEIVAGAIQDNDRGMVVGRRSFGKGLVQSQLPLPDNSALRITTSRYYTPSGRCIQRAYDKGSTAYMLVHYLNMYSDSARYLTPDTMPYRTRNGRIVYGGGGIMPDHLLHAEMDEKVVYFNQLKEAGLFSEVALNEVIRRWEMLMEKYPDADSFVEKYRVSDTLFDQLLQAGDSKKIERQAPGIAKYNNEMRHLLKAHMARYLYDEAAFYRILLPDDSELHRTIRFVEEGNGVATTQP